MPSSVKKKSQMVNSMTGLGSAVGQVDGHRWTIEIRSVNARGLDVRLRIPDGIPGLEKTIRARVSGGISRGSVNVSIRVGRDDAVAGLGIDPARIEAAIDAIVKVEEIAAARGQLLESLSAADILSMRGVADAGREGEAEATLLEPIMLGFESALVEFLSMRADEGSAVERLLRGQVDQVAVLTDAATQVAGDRTERTRDALGSALAKISDMGDALDPGRIEAELAMIAVKADVTEELDRLRAHVTAARALLDAGGPIGRKLDFLTQEFNREANTLCSKAGSSDLTRVGLDLKAVIDQMREQVQNVE